MLLRRAAAAVAVLVLALPLTASAAPGACRLFRGADTPDTADDVEICREDVWFHGDKAGNLAGAELAPSPGWDTNKPTQAIAGGGGSFYAANSVTEIAMTPYGPESGPTFSGTFTGTMENIAVDLFVVDPLRTQLGEAGSVRTRLVVDGELLYAEEEALDVVTTPEGDLRRLSFAFTGLHDTLTSLRRDNAADTVHEIELSVLVFYFGDDSVFVYDAADAPSGAVFNLESEALRGYTPIKLSFP